MLPGPGLFRSRWTALIFAGGMIWTALDVAGGDGGNASAPAAMPTDALGQTLTNADFAVIANTIASD